MGGAMSSRRRAWRAWGVAFAVLGCLFSAGDAGSGVRGQATPDATVEVTADRMISDTRSDQIAFSGNVEARRGDLIVKADRLDVTQERQSKRVSQMVAIGNVQIKKGEQAATADQATFLESEQKVVLTGNPRAWEGTSEVRGEEMVFLLAEEKMIVTGGAQRVRMQMLPGSAGTNLPTAKARGQGG